MNGRRTGSGRSTRMGMTILGVGFAVANLALAETAAAALPDTVGATNGAVTPQKLAYSHDRLDLLQTALHEEVREQGRQIVRPSTRLARYTVRYEIDRGLADKIAEAAVEEGIDPDLGFRLIRVESRFHRTARSHMGALGLAQVMPATARGLDPEMRSEADILEPKANLRLGFRYLRRMIDRYEGDVRLGLLAYNRGPVAVNRALTRGRDPENGFSHRVLGTRGDRPYRGPGLVDAR